MKPNVNSVFIIYSFTAHPGFFHDYLTLGQHGGLVACTVASKQEGAGFDSLSGAFLLSMWVYSGFLPQSKSIQIMDG